MSLCKNIHYHYNITVFVVRFMKGEVFPLSILLSIILRLAFVNSEKIMNVTQLCSLNLVS